MPFSLFQKQRIKDHIFLFLGALEDDFDFNMEIWCVCAVKIMDRIAYALFSLHFSPYKVFRDNLCLSSLQVWNITQKSILGIGSVHCLKWDCEMPMFCFFCSLLSSKFLFDSSNRTTSLFLANFEGNVSKSKNSRKTSCLFFFFFPGLQYFKSATDTNTTCHDVSARFKIVRGPSDILPASNSDPKSAKSQSWAGWYSLASLDGRGRHLRNTPKNLSCLCSLVKWRWHALI
jgi:hypothetical protein